MCVHLYRFVFFYSSQNNNDNNNNMFCLREGGFDKFHTNTYYIYVSAVGRGGRREGKRVLLNNGNINNDDDIFRDNLKRCRCRLVNIVCENKRELYHKL